MSVGHGRRIPARGVRAGAGRVGPDRRPRRAAGIRVLEGDGLDPRAGCVGVGAEVDRSAQVVGGGARRAGRRRRVDQHGRALDRLDVAGVVDREVGDRVRPVVRAVCRSRDDDARADGVARVAVDAVLGDVDTGAAVVRVQRDGDRGGLPAARCVVGGARLRVVDEARHRSGGGHVAGRVGCDDAQIDVAVRHGGRVEVRAGRLPRRAAVRGVLVRDRDDAGGIRAARVTCGGRQVDGATQVWAGARDGGVRRSVVDETVGDRCRSRLIACDVVGHGAEVVVAVRDARRVEARLEAVARRRVRRDGRPRAAARRGALEVHVVDAGARIACGARQRLRRAQVLARIVLARRRRCVVDPDRRAEHVGCAVACSVGDDDPQLVDAVRNQCGVPEDVVERRRGVGSDRRPGRAVCGVLESDGCDPRLVAVRGRIVLRGREGHDLADVVAGIVQGRIRRVRVAVPRPAVGCRVRVARGVGRAYLEGVRVVGEARRRCAGWCTGRIRRRRCCIRTSSRARRRERERRSPVGRICGLRDDARVRSGPVDVDVADRRGGVTGVVRRNGRERMIAVGSRDCPRDAVRAGCGDGAERAPDAARAIVALNRCTRRTPPG